MEHIQAVVASNKPVANGYFSLTLNLPHVHQAPKPGQFLTARVGDGISPLLRRPFAYAGHTPLASAAGTSVGTADGAGQSNGQIEILYERRGNATQALTAYEAGDTLDIMGPLGNTFPDPDPKTIPVLIGGGIGMGPILFFYQDLIQRGIPAILAVGSRSADRIPTLPGGSIVATDDGSLGFKGTIVAALQAQLDPNKSYTLYACGPHGMMKAVRTWCGSWGTDHDGGGNTTPPRLWVSLEQTMACAVGACMGCVVRVHGDKPWARVCTEGPVFDAATIQWEAS